MTSDTHSSFFGQTRVGRIELVRESCGNPTTEETKKYGFESWDNFIRTHKWQSIELMTYLAIALLFIVGSLSKVGILKHLVVSK